MGRIDLIKKSFDVVYEPQLNIVCSAVDKTLSRFQLNQPDKLKNDFQTEDNAAESLFEKPRRNSQPASPDRYRANCEQLECLEVTSHISEEYVYKSPSKMTSPEKKAFS